MFIYTCIYFLVPSKPFVKPSKVKEGSDETRPSPQIIVKPRYDPSAPNALVLPRPTQSQLVSALDKRKIKVEARKVLAPRVIWSKYQRLNFSNPLYSPSAPNVLVLLRPTHSQLVSVLKFILFHKFPTFIQFQPDMSYKLEHGSWAQSLRNWT